MDINTYIKFLCVYILVDMIWIIGAQKMHAQTVKDVQKSEMSVDKTAVAVYYMMAPLAYLFFIKPLSKTKLDIVKNSVLMGLLMYGTFDLTNKAIFSNYSWKYTMADISWGIFSITATSLLISA